MEQTFVKQLEGRLKAAEVLNFGVSGFGTAQELLAYRHYVRPYRPDLVVLTMCPGNDIADNSKALSRDYPRPYFLLKDGRLEPDNTFRQSRRHQFLRRFGGLYYLMTDHSALAENLDRLRRRMAQRRTRQAAGEWRATSPTTEAGLAPGIFGPPANEQWGEAWEITERLIADLSKSVRDDGSSLVIMTVTVAAQVDPQLREQSAHERPSVDLDYADRRIQQFAQDTGVPCLALGPGFLKHAKKTGRQLHGFGDVSRGHWNAEGHRMSAELLYQFLVERRLVPPQHLQQADAAQANRQFKTDN